MNIGDTVWLKAEVENIQDKEKPYLVRTEEGFTFWTDEVYETPPSQSSGPE